MFNEIYKHTKYFVEECGKRTAGTEAVIKASDYIVDYYKKNGIKTEIHEFNVPVCEIEKSQLKFKTTEGWLETEHTAALFSKATPDGGITLPLVYAENGSIANLKDVDVKGKAVLICRDVYMEYPDMNSEQPPLYTRQTTDIGMYLMFTPILKPWTKNTRFRQL